MPWIEAPYSPSDYLDKDLRFPIYYAKLFEELEKNGVSSVSIESSLSTYSIGGFKNNIKSKYPNLTTKIEQIIVPYE
jgi:hypothetical protein